MEAGRQRALVRVAITARKHQQQGGSSVSTSKVVTKGALKRKSDGKDVCPSKKGIGSIVSDK